MHKEVKIGLLFGLAVLALILIYFSVVGEGLPEPQEPTSPVAAEPSPVPIGGVPVAAADPNDASLAADEDRPIAPVTSRTPAGVDTPESDQPIVVPTSELPVIADEGTSAAAGAAPLAITPPAVKPVTAAGTSVAASPAGDKRIYTVTEEDRGGFWTVSEKVYDDGQYWYQIARANPDADTNALRAGQKLVIPPLPNATPSKTNAPTGKLMLSGGKKIYTVQKSDIHGFWGIAKKVYKHGKYHTLIAKANPQADTNALRVGQKLVIPPITTALTPTPVAPAAGGVPTGAGKVYVVQAGDAGFWGIAKKEYGYGKYHALIAGANPGVDPHKLRVGQKLVIPPLPSADKIRLSGTARSRPAEAPAADGRPMFD